MKGLAINKKKQKVYDVLIKKKEKKKTHCRKYLKIKLSNGVFYHRSNFKYF